MILIDPFNYLSPFSYEIIVILNWEHVKLCWKLELEDLGHGNKNGGVMASKCCHHAQSRKKRSTMKMDSTWRVWTYEFGLGRTKNVLGFGLLFSVHQIEKDWTHGRQQETIVGAQKATFKMEHVVRVVCL